MKIAQVAPICYPIINKNVGGVERFIYGLCRSLKKSGHDVTLFASGDSFVPGIKIMPICRESTRKGDDWTREFFAVAIKSEMAYYFNFMNRLDELKDDFDIIHINGYNFLLMAMQTEGLRKKTITTLHLPVKNPFIDSAMLSMGAKKFEKLNFVVISDFQKKHAGNLNVFARVYNGIDIDSFAFEAKPERYYSWLGRMSSEKGLDVAIQMAREREWNLRIAGTKPNVKYFKEKIEPYLGSKIKYLGEIDEKDKSNFYGKSEVFLMPVQWDEPFGLTVIEAMACGTPVVAYKRGAMAELIEDGVTGYIVEPGDKKGFIKAAERAKSLDRKKCHERVKKLFTLEKMVDGYEEVYKKVIADSNRQ